MAKKRRKSGKPDPEPNMPTLDELVDIGIGRQVHKALADSNKADEFYKRMREIEAFPDASSPFVSGFRIPINIGTQENPVEPKPPEVPTYPAAQPRKMRIKP